jgi:hypothetical protein
MANPAKSHKLDDRATQKLINHPLVQRAIPSLHKVAQQTAKKKRCGGCKGRRVRRGSGTPDLNAVREAVANLPQEQKAHLKKLLNTEQLVVPYKRASDKRKVRLKF